MAETADPSDMDLGLGIAFSVVALLAALAMAGTAYLSPLTGSEWLQFLSAVSIAVAFVAGSLAITAMHVFER